MRLKRDRAQATVPAVATGLGASPASLALPLGIGDSAVINAVAGPTQVLLRGRTVPSADPAGETHPVVKAVRATLDHFGASQVGVQLHLQAGIPRGRGLGSFSADTLLGIVAAHQLVDQDPDVDVVCSLAASLGAETLRVRAGFLSTALLAVGEAPRAFVPLAVPPLVDPVAFVPNFGLGDRSLSASRLTLDESSAESARTGLLTLLLSGAELDESAGDFDSLLMRATEDRFGLATCAASAPASVALIGWLRDNGVPAVLSGNGPAVLSLLPVPAQIRSASEQSGWEVIEVGSGRSD